MQRCGMPTRALAIRTMSSVSAAAGPNCRSASNARKGSIQRATDDVQAQLGHRSLPQLDHADLADHPRRSRDDAERGECPDHAAGLDDSRRQLSLDQRDQRDARHAAGRPGDRRRITMLREDRSKNRNRFIGRGPLPLSFRQVRSPRRGFRRASGQPALHDRVVVARHVMGRDASERQAFPAPCRVVIERISARSRADQDHATGVGARPIAIQSQPVCPEDLVEPPQSFGPISRAISLPRIDRSNVPSRIDSGSRPRSCSSDARSAPRGSSEVGREGHQLSRSSMAARAPPWRAPSNRSGRRAAPRARPRRAAGHLESHDAPHRPAAQEVGPGGVPARTHRRIVTPSARGPSRVRGLLQGRGLETEDGASSIEAAGQRVVAEDPSADRMHEKERPARPRTPRSTNERAAVGTTGSPSRAARSSIVEPMSRSDKASDRPNRSSIRAASRTARSEWPPRSKKSSVTPIGRICSRSSQIAASCSSTLVARTDSPSAVATCSGRDTRKVCRSTLPEGVRGRASRSESATGSSGAEACRGAIAGLRRHGACCPPRRRCRR